MKDIRIKYLKEITPLEYIEDKSDWIDLRSAEDIYLKKGDFALIPLGVAMEIPEGYEAHIAPRSSTFKKLGLIQTNSVGVIDNTFCGNTDEWKMPVYATKDTHIKFNQRICQFRIFKNQPRINFKVVDDLENESRGGFGTTGEI